MNADSGTVRVFFALWPTDDVRDRIYRAAQGLHRRLGGRLTRPDTLHLTLVFLGDVDSAKVVDLATAAGQIHSPGFELALDTRACWARNHIAHLTISTPSPGLLGLVEQLSDRLREAGVTFDARRYVPHVTLIRHADCSRFPEPANEHPAPEPLFWSARDFVLVKSSLRPEGARYEQLGRWPLL